MSNINDILNQRGRVSDPGTLNIDNQPTSPPSPTALILDRWGMRRAKDIHQLELCSKHLTKYEEEEAINIIADAHGCLFNYDHQFAPNPQNKRRSLWFKDLVNLPEFKALHKETCLDTTYAAIGAASIVQKLAEYEAQQSQNNHGNDGNDNDEDDNIEQQIKRLRAATQAVQQAQNEIDQAKAMAIGLGSNEASNEADQEKIIKIYNDIKTNRFLNKIAQYAGRAIRMAQGLQKSKLTSDNNTIAGIKLGKSISSMLPSEQALVCGIVPEMQQHALYRMTQGRSLCYKYQRKEKTARGPIVVIIDESGSMTSNDNIYKAKAIALAICWIAKQQQRWSAYVGFADAKYLSTSIMPPNPTPAHTEQFVEWLRRFNNGGTSFVVPFHTTPFKLWKEWEQQGLVKGKTDIIVITDAEVGDDEKLAQNYKQWAKEQEVCTYGIHVGGYDSLARLTAFCDKVWQDKQIDFSNQSVTQVLSI